MGSTLSNVEIDVSGAKAFGLYSYGYQASIDRVIVHSLGAESETCEIFPATTMTNSVCVADGPNSYAFIMYSSEFGRDDTAK